MHLLTFTLPDQSLKVRRIECDPAGEQCFAVWADGRVSRRWMKRGEFKSLVDMRFDSPEVESRMIVNEFGRRMAYDWLSGSELVRWRCAARAEVSRGHVPANTRAAIAYVRRHELERVKRDCAEWVDTALFS